MTALSVVVLVIVLGGAAGGAANFLLAPNHQDTPKRFRDLLELVFAGIIVAFTVPLFLSLAPSSLIKDILSPGTQHRHLEILILVGFCIAVAFVSRAFMDGLGRRLLLAVGEVKAIARDAHIKAEQAEESAGLAEEGVDRISGAATLTPIPTPAEVASDLEAAPSQFSLTSDQRKVLQAAGRLTMRTATGIAKDAGVPRNQVGEILDELIRMGLVEKTTSPNTGGLRHRATSAGISAINQMLKGT